MSKFTEEVIMIEAFLFIGIAILIGRVLAEFHRHPMDLGLSKYRVSADEYRRRNKDIYL